MRIIFLILMGLPTFFLIVEIIQEKINTGMVNSYNYIIKITITILFGATEFVQTNFVICPYIMTEMIWQPMILEENV